MIIDNDVEEDALQLMCIQSVVNITNGAYTEDEILEACVVTTSLPYAMFELVKKCGIPAAKADSYDLHSIRDRIFYAAELAVDVANTCKCIVTEEDRQNMNDLYQFMKYRSALGIRVPTLGFHLEHLVYSVPFVEWRSTRA